MYIAWKNNKYFKIIFLMEDACRYAHIFKLN